MTLPAPCLTCGQPAMLTQSRCADCYRVKRAADDRATYARKGRRKRPEREMQQGAWRRLSRKARALQPFCSDCGRTASQLADFERLEADHTPQSWHRVLSGLAVRLQDVDVVCSSDNAKRGDAKPGSDRYARWAEANHVEPLEMSA